MGRKKDKEKTLKYKQTYVLSIIKKQQQQLISNFSRV